MVLYAQSKMKKVYVFCIVISFAAFTLAAVFPSQSIADGGCSPLFNGGSTNQQFCPTPTPTVWPTPAPFKEYIPPQSSGGQKIYPVDHTTKTPDTGPDDWSVPALLFLGGIGFLFRKMSKIVTL